MDVLTQPVELEKVLDIPVIFEDNNPLTVEPEMSMDTASRCGNIGCLDLHLQRYLSGIAKLLYTYNALDDAVTYDRIEVVEWWLKQNAENNIPIKCLSALNVATMSSNYRILDLLLNSDVEFVLQESIIDAATKNGTKMLEWWLQAYLSRGIEFKCYKNTILYATHSSKRIEILSWWLDVNLKYSIELIYDERSLDNASENGYLDVLDWWKNSGLFLKYTSKSLDSASVNAKFDVLNWWLALYNEGDYQLKYTEDPVNRASRNGSIEVLDWWLNLHTTYGLPFLYNKHAFSFYRESYFYKVYGWWFSAYDSGIVENKIDRSTIDNLSNCGCTGSLELIFHYYQQRGIPFPYTANAIDEIFDSHAIVVLNWWKSKHLEYGLELKYTGRALVSMSIPIYEWWIDSGLVLPDRYSMIYSATYYGTIRTLDFWLKMYIERDIPFQYRSECIKAVIFYKSDKMVEWWRRAFDEYNIPKLENLPSF